MKISPKDLTKRIRQLNAEVFYGGTMIPKGENLQGPIVVIDGPLDIQEGAVLEGDAWVVNGSLVITGGGTVNGRVSLVNSQVFVSHHAMIEGGLSHYHCECRIDAEAYENEDKIEFEKYEDPMVIRSKFAVEVGRPTRVRYDVIRLGIKRENKLRRDPYIRYKAMINIPLYKTTQHGFLGFDAYTSVPLSGHALVLELSGYKTLHTEDSFQVSRNENVLLLTLSANEYANYYEKRGGGVGINWLPSPFVTVNVTGFFQRDVSMRTQEVLTIMGPRDDLPENPPIEEGERVAGRVTMTVDTREEPDYPANAWLFRAAIESGRLSPDVDGSDRIDYTAFTIEANRYTRFPFGLQWDIGTRLTSSFDRIPHQLYQTLNGYGGIRGTDRVPFDVPRGDRMMRLSTEFRVELPELPVVRWIYSRWDLLGFADAGLLAEAQNPTSPFDFLDTSFDNWKKSVGLGVSGESFVPYVGFYVAREINGDRKKPRFIIRIERSF